MSSALAPMTRAAPQSWLRLWTAAAAIGLLSGNCALAQTASGSNRMFGAGVQDARVQAAYAEWRRLSQSEVNCVDQSLRAKRSNLWFLIQRGIDPSDSAVAGVRAACRTQARAPGYSVVAHGASQALAASVASAADKAAADKLAADKAAAEKAAADKVAAEKVATAKAAADRAAADKAAADKAVADKAAADRAAADNAAIDLAKAEAERAKADAAKAQADAERLRKEAEKPTAGAELVYSAAELRTSFVYGLMSSPILFGLGGVAFLVMRRKRSIAGARSEAAATGNAGSEDQGEFDRLVTAVIAEQKRRDRKQPSPIAPEREQRVDEAALH